ncbi:hypothetical protein [Streptomyces sp. NPDC051286]|uniref:hypothetical protein n=1 Tax=Streptomyces sp. NPDC051286 TaxID=3365647 RepID=UPI003794DE51
MWIDRSIYVGTGTYKAPFASRTKIGAGWNTYNTVFAPGDIDPDCVTDLASVFHREFQGR